VAKQYLHPIFSAVVNPHPKHTKRAFLRVITSEREGIALKQTPKKMRGLLTKTLNYALPYERGLFVWRMASLPKTKNETEIFYHEKKGASSRATINNYLKRIPPISWLMRVMMEQMTAFFGEHQEHNDDGALSFFFRTFQKGEAISRSRC